LKLFEAKEVAIYHDGPHSQSFPRIEKSSIEEEKSRRSIYSISLRGSGVIELGFLTISPLS
jgi:hypothetical protein